MKLADLIREYRSRLESKYGSRLLPSHVRAMDDILRCRTPEAGMMIVQCPDCHNLVHLSHSCGHRSCPACQNHETGAWLDRQRQKLLPIPYFLVTFTLPASLRSLAWRNQQRVFSCLFAASAKTLKTFGADTRFLGGTIGMTGVLHTHSRKLDFHPHIHYLIPGGAIDRRNHLWKRKDWNFLFPEKAVAKVFREKFLAGIRQEGLPLPDDLYAHAWVVNCRKVGTGEPALKYLSRYLYRGILSEKRIIANRDGKVSFRYRESRAGGWKTRTLPGEDFLWLIVQHVLPRGFRRARDFGFLHGNAGRILRLIQLLLHAKVPPRETRHRPPIPCPACGAGMTIVAVRVQVSRLPCGPP